MSRSMMILIAGPYRSGTGDDPVKMSANLKALEAYAPGIFAKGHVPMIGEWVALPVLDSLGKTAVDPDATDDFLYPTAQRLIEHCDAVLRVPGTSKGADQDVALAIQRGIPVYTSLTEIPKHM